jgi:hypothetical protein
MSSVVINLNESCGEQTSTPGNFNVRAHYNETDAGHLFEGFTNRERAEQCLLVLAGRSDVVKAKIEPVI